MPMLAFLDYNIDADSCYPWSVLDLHVGEINVLSNHNFYIITDYL